MKISLTNVGKIGQAEVKLNGLTVIAGPNDSGKSTLGRALYSILRANGMAIDSERDAGREIVYNLFSRLYSLVGLKRFTSPELSLLLPTTVELATDRWTELATENERAIFVNKIIQAVSETDLTPRIKSLCYASLNELPVKGDGGDTDSGFANAFQELIATEFSGSFTSYGTDGSIVVITNDADNKSISVEVKDNLCRSARMSKALDFPLDATLIDSPLYLNLSRTIQNGMRNPDNLIQSHIADFIDKASMPALLDKGGDDKMEDVLREGRFVFDSTSRQLVFERGGARFPISNVASGLKTFGILQLFLSNGVASPEKMLIWDEPENHLHPKWQLNFAEILVNMAKEGYPLLVSTHSPYFLQAVRYYAASTGMEANVDYYSSDCDESTGLNRLRHVNGCLNDVFITLAEPLNSIMNVDLARDKYSAR